MKRRRTISLAVALAAALLCGCSPQPTGRMVSIPPPAYWTEEVEGLRAARDELFRSSEETPLMAEDLASFRGLEYWELDPAYYFVGPINAYPRPEPFSIVTTSGASRRSAWAPAALAAASFSTTNSVRAEPRAWTSGTARRSVVPPRLRPS